MINLFLVILDRHKTNLDLFQFIHKLGVICSRQDICLHQDILAELFQWTEILCLENIVSINYFTNDCMSAAEGSSCELRSVSRD
jgi:hypothetical protein